MVVRVGIRDLQHNASRVVDRVKAGETVEITERGRLVAVLSPPSSTYEAREQLIASGTLVPGRGGLLDWQPRSSRPDVRPLSEVLAELRDEDER